MMYRYLAWCLLAVSSLSTVLAESSHTIGIHLFSLDSEMKNDTKDTFKRLAKIGYKEVEFAGNYIFKQDAYTIRAWLDQYGLKSSSTHISINNLRIDLQKTIDRAKIIGQKYIILPWLNIKEFNTSDKWKDLAEELNLVGAKLKKEGLIFAYHNHEFEFMPLKDGGIPYDILLELTNPNLVKLELDLYGIVKAGKDPYDYLNKHPGRFKLCHIKDMTKAGKMIDVGLGSIEFEKILAAARKAGVEYFMIDDRPKDQFLTVKNSLKHVKGLNF